MDIYLLRGEQQEGPYDERVIAALVDTGAAGPQTLCWTAGFPDWRPLSEVISFAGAPVLPPPARCVAAPREELVWSGHRSLCNYWASWVLAAVCLLAAVVAIPYLAVLGVAILICAFISRARWKYTVTNRKVIVRQGLLIHSSREVRVKDIRSINVARSGLTGLMGIGSVEFSSAARDDADVIFAGIANAERIRQFVSEMQE